MSGLRQGGLRQGGLRHIASLSGGKDSVAMCLHLRELGIEHERVFFDTGWEHPDLYAHLDYLEGELGPIKRLAGEMPDLPDEVMPEVLEIERLAGVSPSGFVRWAVHKAFFPSRKFRWCTQQLKIKPFLAYIDSLDEDVVDVVGIRAEESEKRARMPEREDMPGAEHIEVWRPLLKWTEDDVIAIHKRHGVRPCPLYLRGSTRVGCWPCIQGNKRELGNLARDSRRVEAIRKLETLVQRRARQRDEARGMEKNANPPTMFQQSLRRPDGTRPCVPIDDVLAWASTKRGGRQMSFNVSWGQESGCVRWGMCEGVKR